MNSWVQYTFIWIPYHKKGEEMSVSEPKMPQSQDKQKRKDSLTPVKSTVQYVPQPCCIGPGSTFSFWNLISSSVQWVGYSLKILMAPVQWCSKYCFYPFLIFQLPSFHTQARDKKLQRLVLRHLAPQRQHFLPALDPRAEDAVTPYCKPEGRSQQALNP